jgi:uncharacterized lipoprotein YajG
MKLHAIIITASILLLAGCSAPSEPPAEPTATAVTIEAASITTIDDGIGWARSLDQTVRAAELAEGVQKIGDLVPQESIWFSTKNKIGGELISLNAEIQADPGSASVNVDDLNAIVDDIEAAIAHGNKP